MASEPITIFSHRVDPAAVLAVVLQLVPDATVTRDGDDWLSIDLRFKRGLLRSSLDLQLNHDRDYYAGDGWGEQIAGMQGYFSRFPMDEQREAEVMATIRSFRFSLGTIMEADLVEDDPRVNVIEVILQVLDGCAFSPGYLRDSGGMTLISAEGEYDADAVFPARPGQEALLPPLVVLDPDDDDDDDEDDFDDYEDPEPPSRERVISRLLVLAAVAGRGVLEMQAEGDPEHEVAGMQPRLAEWLEALGLRDEAEETEWRCLTTPVGEIDQQDAINCLWRLEGLGVLAWALELYELPRYDTLVDLNELFPSVAFLDEEGAQELQANAQLRAPAELQHFGEQMLAYHWRLRDFSIRAEAMDFRGFGETCWFGPIAMDWAEFGDDNDLVLDGHTICTAPPDVIGRSSSTAMERHLAINWLRGYAGLYSDTDTST